MRKGEGDRKSFTGGPASSLRSLQKGTIMRIHWGKDSRPFPRMYIVKMQASAHSRKRDGREDWRGNKFSMRFNIAEIRVF